jgi:lysophospholipase L1-like esterase
VLVDKFLIPLLGPILLAQGKNLRKTMPVLPEPPGDRSGVRGQGQPLRLLIAGDSSAAGVGADHQDDALLGHVLAGLGEDFRVEYRLVAATGSTTRGTVRRLNNLPAEDFDVAVTALGANDSTRLVSVKDFLASQTELLDLLKEKFNVGAVVCSGLPPMHLFPAMPQPLRWVIGRRAKALDHALRQWLPAHPHGHFLKSDYTLDPQFMATDGFHPGPEVYRMWGEAVSRHIRQLLR